MRNQAQRFPPKSIGDVRWWTALGGLLVGAISATALCAPARWLADSISRATTGRISFQETQGTVWRGSAVLILRGGSDSVDFARLPGRVDWRLGLSAAGLGVHLNAACCAPKTWLMNVMPRWGGADFNLRIPPSTLPAQLLAGLGTPWNTLGLHAQFGLSSQSLEFVVREGRVAVAGAAQLDVVNAQTRLSTLKPVGSYRLVLNGGDVASVKLSTIEGALQLSGEGQWIGQRLRFSGVASAQPDQEAVLQNLLNIIGRRQGTRSIISIG